MNKLTGLETAALAAYAAENGRTWKNKLRADWMKASYPSMYGALAVHAPTLQQLRNDPDFDLAKFNLKDYLTEVQKAAMIGARVFCGCYPTGLVWSDKHNQKAGDYKRLAYLNYATLQLDVEKDCPEELATWIRESAAKVQAKRGQAYSIAGNASVILGHALPALSPGEQLRKDLTARGFEETRKFNASIDPRNVTMQAVADVVKRTGAKTDCSEIAAGFNAPADEEEIEFFDDEDFDRERAQVARDIAAAEQERDATQQINYFKTTAAERLEILVDRYEADAQESISAAALLLYDAAKKALLLIKKSFPLEHGNKEIGETWNALEVAIAEAQKPQ
jgi:hypothetical protein